MPVSRIERIQKGVVTGAAEPNETGHYVCHVFGSNVDPQAFSTLDAVAAYLRANPRAGVRMNPNWQKIVRNIYIDGMPR